MKIGLSLMEYIVPDSKILSAEEMGELLYESMEEIDHEINRVFEAAASHGHTTLASKNPGEMAELLPLLKQRYEGRSHDGYLVSFHDIEVVKTTTKAYSKMNNLRFDEKRDQNNLVFVEERLKCKVRIKEFERWLKRQP